MNIRCLSYQTLSEQDSQLVESILEVLSEYNAKNSSEFVYKETRPGAWSISGTSTSGEELIIPVVDNVFTEPVVSVMSGSLDEELFYEVAKKALWPDNTDES